VAQQESLTPIKHTSLEAMCGIETAADGPSEPALAVWEAEPLPQDVGEEPLVKEPATREEDAHDSTCGSEYSSRPQD